jgi:integrase
MFAFWQGIWHGSRLIRRSSEASKVIRNRGDYWQVKVYAGRDPLTGRERYEYDRARTKREAVRLEAALKTKVAEGRHRSTAAWTIADLVERWYQWRQGVKEISPTTLEGYRRQIDQRIIPALGRIPVRRLDVETLDSFYAELRRRGKDGGLPLSASTVRAVHTVLSSDDYGSRVERAAKRPLCQGQLRE